MDEKRLDELAWSAGIPGCETVTIDASEMFDLIHLARLGLKLEQMLTAQDIELDEVSPKTNSSGDPK